MSRVCARACGGLGTEVCASGPGEGSSTCHGRLIATEGVQQIALLTLERIDAVLKGRAFHPKKKSRNSRMISSAIKNADDAAVSTGDIERCGWFDFA